MLRTTTIALVASALLSVIAPSTASAQFCYGTPGLSRCAGVGLGLQSPRWYFSDHYPYFIYDYPFIPYPALGSGIGGCRIVERVVRDGRGLHRRTACI